MTALFWFHVVVQLTPAGGLLANQHWALIHEGLHGRLPWWQTQVLCALFGSPARQLRNYHLKHHRVNRVEERIDELPAWLYYPQLLGGLYVLEVLLCLTRREGVLLILPLHAGLLWFWGPWYVASLCVRALLVSVLDYVYHFRGETDRLQGYDLDAGKWGRRYLLGFNAHGAHHRQPSIPGPALTVDRYDGRLLPAVLAQFRR